MRHHLAPRDVDETKAPLAAARDKKITSTRAEGGRERAREGAAGTWRWARRRGAALVCACTNCREGGTDTQPLLLPLQPVTHSRRWVQVVGPRHFSPFFFFFKLRKKKNWSESHGPRRRYQKKNITCGTTARKEEEGEEDEEENEGEEVSGEGGTGWGWISALFGPSSADM